MRIWRAGLLMGGTKQWALVLLLVASCVDSPDTLPSTASTSTPTTTSTSVAEFEWPVVVARDFIHRPRGLVSGVPISFPDPMYCGCSAVTLDDGRVLMVGSGYGIGYAAWIWDPATREWAATGDPISEWTFATPGVILLDDGRVLTALHGHLEIYEPETGSFHQLDYPASLGSLDGSFSGVTTPAVMGDGRVFLATGSRGGVVFDPESEGFAAAGSTAEPDLDVIAAVALDDGRVLVVSYKTVSVYDPATDSFDRLDPVFPPERGVGVARLTDGRVIFTGGESWSYQSETPLDLGSAEVQIFDPTTDRFVAAHPMLEPRSHHSAVAMSDGRVAIIGGAQGRVELFDPDTGLFSQLPELSRPRERPTVTPLDDGSFLIVGGVDAAADTASGDNLDTTTFRTAEIYHTQLPSIEPSEDVLSGFTLSLEPDIDWSQTKERPTGSQWLELDVPPGGLHGVAYAQAAWEFSPPNNPGETRITWVGADTRIWGLGGIERQLPDTCDDGCVIREEMFESLPWAATFTGLYLHIQYEGVIPAEASEITLTIVND